MKKKTVALLLTCMLTLGVAVGGTLAWLTDTSDKVTNTFTVGDIGIGLKETKYDSKKEDVYNYDFMPGDIKAKDPTVTVNAKSEDCYLFIKVAEKNNSCTVGTDTVNSIVNWTVRGQETDPVNSDAKTNWVFYQSDLTNSDEKVYFYYRLVSKSDSEQKFYVFTGEGAGEFANGKVELSEDITKSMVETINATATQPTITVTAAAVQQANIADVATAWSKLPSSFTGVTSGTSQGNTGTTQTP